MKADAVVIERVTEVTDELVEVVARLLPQVSSTASAPDRTALFEMLASRASALFLARRGPGADGVIGMITLVTYRTPTGVHALIEDVVVEESARGAGVGGALLAEAVGLARSHGARHVNLTSRASRESANRLYVRAGFEARNTNVYRLSFS